MKRFGLIVLLSTVFVAGVRFSGGQTSTGTIAGTVQDATAAVVPGATVTVTNSDTGIKRTAVTDEVGRYHMPGLIPGSYEVQVQATGFQTEIRKGIQLTVGSEIAINLSLQVGQVEQTTIVTAEAPLVETSTSTISGLVTEQTIQDLPLNGRSFDQLISLQSSAPTIRARGRTSLTGQSDVFSVSGARTQSNQFLMDGTEVVGAGSITTLPGGVLGKNMGVEAVQEFTVLTSNYSAAYGKRSGGVINVATRSGTNSLHGSVFEFLRNDNLDARNFFDIDPENPLERSDPPEFRRNQFGFAVGGPLRRDRSFFFGTYEGLRESLGETSIALVPDNNARQGLLEGPAGTFENVGVAANVRDYMTLFPAPNGQVFHDGTAESHNSPTRPSQQDFFLVRVDHRISDKDSVFARYNFTQADLQDPDDNPFFASFDDNRDQVLSLEAKRVYPKALHTLRFGFTRAHVFTDSLPVIDIDPSLVFLPGAKTIGPINFGTSTVGGTLTQAGTGTSAERRFTVNQFEVAEQTYYYRGSHSFVFGGNLQRIQHNENFQNSVRGSFEFANLRNFLRGVAQRFRAPAPTTTGIADATKAYRQIFFSVYAQDDYKAFPNVTLNLGVRYEMMSVPVEASGNRISNFRGQGINGVRFLNATPTTGEPFFQPHHKSFAPRLGFAWDLKGDGKTALRGGFGMFFDQIESEFRFFTANNAPFFSLTQVDSPPFPSGFGTGTGSVRTLAPDSIDYFIDVPTRLYWNFTLQRQVAANTVVNAGYVGSESYHLTRNSDQNAALPITLSDGTKFYPLTSTGGNPPRKVTTLGGNRFVSTDANASYHGMQLDVIQRLASGFRAKASYTLAKSIDNASVVIAQHSTGTPANTMDPDDLGRDRGLSSFDVRQNLTLNFNYDLPWTNQDDLLGRIVGGWQVGSIVSIQDGTPFTAQTGFAFSRDQNRSIADRPNLKPGRSNNPVLGGPNKYYDASAFELPPAVPGQAPGGVYGNLGRNTIIGPGLVNFDFDLAKTIPVTEQVRMDFRAEFFNLFNKANFGLPDFTLFTATDGVVRPAAGRISTTTTTSRQVQFGLKLIF